MQGKFNNLLTYIYDYSEKLYKKETIDILFRSILEPLIQNQKVEGCAFIRISDTKDKKSILKRLEFSNIKLYNFNENKDSCQNENIWNNLEFIVVLSSRYSSALIWDYSDSNIKNSSRICLLYNSRLITDIAKIITDNSKDIYKTELKELIKKYIPDRRENRVLNASIQSITNSLNDFNEELLFQKIENNSEILNTAHIINDKARFISHEIKNYLSVINLYSKILSKRIENVKTGDETLKSIENSICNITNSSENISYLINDLRCMSSVVKTDISIKTLVDSSIELVNARINKENVKLQIINKEDEIVSTDKVKVECAITNIIFNAIDAKAKNIIVEVNKNIIIIKNDGEEIIKNNQPKIFEDNFTTKATGNGLGLAFCKKELNKVNGDITFISSNKKETIFEIRV